MTSDKAEKALSVAELMQFSNPLKFAIQRAQQANFNQLAEKMHLVWVTRKLFYFYFNDDTITMHHSESSVLMPNTHICLILLQFFLHFS